MSHQSRVNGDTKFDATPFTIITCRDCPSDQQSSGAAAPRPMRLSNAELLEELDFAVYIVLRDIISRSNDPRDPDKCTAKDIELVAQYLKIKGFTFSRTCPDALPEAVAKCGREFEDRDRLEDFNLPFGDTE